MFWLLITLGSLLEVVGDLFFRKQTYFIGSLFYGIGTIFWALSLRYETLSKAIILFSVCNVLVVAFAGLLIFKENLSLTQWVGVSLGLGCLAILS